MAQIKKKVTVKDVAGNKDILKQIAEKAKGKPARVCDIIGLVTKTTVKETDKGTSILFSGSFEGVNAETGEVTVAGQCYLPEVVESIVAAQFMSDDVSSVQFAWSIFVQADETSVTGYIYTAEPLINEEEANPLNALKAKIAGQLEDKSKAA